MSKESNKGMLSLDEIVEVYYKLDCSSKVKILLEAMEYMQQYNGRSKSECIALSMGYYQIYEDDEEYWVKL